MRKIIIITAAAVWLAISIYLYIVISFGSLPAGSPGGGVMITETTEVSGDDSLAIDIKRPLVSGLSDREFENELNKKIESQISAAKESAKTAAAEFWKEAKAQGYQPWQYVFHTEYAIKNTKGILSFRVTTILDAGGSGMPLTVYYNADLNKNRLLDLGSLFINNMYKDVIFKIVKGEMNRDPDRYFGTFSEITDKTKFFIYAGSLYITMAKYEVASGATGEPEFLIPTDKIRDNLKDEYKEILK